MALAVASTTNLLVTSGSSNTSRTLPIPSGMNVGDLLVFVNLTGAFNNTSAPPEDATPAAGVPVPFGFTEAEGYAVNTFSTKIGPIVYYRVVDGTETNFTFTSSFFQGAFLHITGWNGVNTNPVFDSVHNRVPGSTTPSSTHTFPLKVPTQSVLLMAGFDSNPTGSVPGNPSITGQPNPTWTTVMAFEDVGISDESGYLVYAETADTSDITGFSISDGGIMQGLFVISSPADASLDVSSLDVLPTTNGLEVSDVTLSASLSTINIPSDFYAVDATATNPTNWQARSKPETTWTPRTK